MLHDAVHFAGKIYGVMENYIVKFDGTTGAKESVAKICSPMYGPMRIAERSGTLYVASADDRHMNWFAGDVSSNKKIWNVDSGTLIASDVLGIDAKAIVSGGVGTTYFGWGPRCMVFNGADLWFIYSDPNGSVIFRIEVTNTVNFNPAVDNINIYRPEQIATDGTSIFVPNAFSVEITAYDAITEAITGFCTTTPYYPMGVACSPGKTYAVCGTDTLIRCDFFAPPHTYTSFNLGAIFANVAPMRIKYNANNGLLYIPCQNQDVVIKWNPTLDTGTYVGGFDSPVDCVFTGSKAFAVQSGLVPLKEII